jgi:cyclopropane fatty-acyl-phospholipid synthase-like methyltransferase
MTLHTHRLNQVATTLKELGVKSVLDLGCGEGKLLRRLLADRTFERIVGMDVSHRSLEIASARLRWNGCRSANANASNSCKARCCIAMAA